MSENGKGLSFVVYTEDITLDPDFSISEDRAGGFLTLEVELGPSPDEVDQLRSELESRAGVGNVTLTQVPFTDGKVTLYILSQTGGTTAGGPKGLEVSIAGSTNPSLFGRQTAVFSVRLGGKAANVLWETLRTSADPQAVVTYDLEFLAIQPSYNLEVVIDFKETFSYLRHRIGVNLLVASVDLDLLTQEMMNQGQITVREVDFSGKGNANSPVAGEGGILKLVRDLMSPTLFTTVPIPTPDYRALPDSATKALETGGGTKAFLTTGSPGGTPTARTPITIGTDLKITHTPAAAGQTPGAAVDIAADVEPATGVTLTQVKVNWRVQGSAAFQNIVLQREGSPGGPTPGGPTPGGPTPGSPTPGSPTPGSPTPGGPTPGGPTPGGPTPGGLPPAARPETGPTTGMAASTFSGRIPGQPAGTTVEYFLSATGTKAGATTTQNLPAQGETAPLSYGSGAATAQGSDGTKFKVPQTDGPLIGYSLRSINVTQQIKRTFTLNRAEAITQHYHPSGALSANEIGPEFNPTKQITRVMLGQGPFKIIVIKVQAGFDFEKNHVKAVAVQIEYSKNQSGTGPLHALTVSLNKDQSRGQVQFFADEQGTQDYTYWVEFTYDSDRVVGTVPGQALRSQTFTGVKSRAITVDLDLHSPLIPVTVEPGVLSFDNGLIKQVQVRVAPSPTTEGRVIQLAKDRRGDTVLVVPLNPLNRSYHMQQKFFFQDGSTTVEKPGVVDTNVIINEPNDLIFKMVPQFADSTNLVKEVLVDAIYTHVTGDEERSTLRLTPQAPRSEFAILLRPNDPKAWRAGVRFVMNTGDPLEALPQPLTLPEPLVTLTKAGFKVITVALLDETIFATDPSLLGVRVTLGQDVNNPALPATSLMLRGSRLAGTVVVPGVLPTAPVSVAVEVMRRGQPAPQRTTLTLSPSEKELFVTT